MVFLIHDTKAPQSLWHLSRQLHGQIGVLGFKYTLIIIVTYYFFLSPMYISCVQGILKIIGQSKSMLFRQARADLTVNNNLADLGPRDVVKFSVCTPTDPMNHRR